MIEVKIIRKNPQTWLYICIDVFVDKLELNFSLSGVEGDNSLIISHASTSLSMKMAKK